ncbi:uncharacterized protein BDR25DRAFT_287961 [Lindgomyces ingoldianus]|uniref:Uncharacterized protein n=1 Tax=Lindgomyces ingoldianus TaxID=673940 RepID=A0ACB6QT51_9PLEO|nr:uncharacterized protein BDR25DRAFT_287961 [Lindgomyces ingoldianus]KAF2470184.1 hypothetical protein BDR25DRAFT_287961 [Lindgomyces ingoldianus]
MCYLNDFGSVIGPWGVKLEALNDDLAIQPARPRNCVGIDAPVEMYTLNQRATNGNPVPTEIIFLREDDKIYWTKTGGNLTLRYNPSEVQVNSSETGQAEIPLSEELDETHVLPSREDSRAESEETEDEDLDQTITAAAISRATPHPSAARSEVVQETPTANRVTQAAEWASKAAKNVVTSDTVENTPPEGSSGMEIYSTAPPKLNAGIPTGPNREQLGQVGHDTVSVRNKLKTEGKTESEQGCPAANEPQRRGRRTLQSVSISKSKSGKKRPSLSPVSDRESVSSTPTHPRKRAKKINEDSQEAMPATTMAGSQHEDAEDGTYKGTKPRVAFSNSSIEETSQFFKFFKRQGGIKVESVKDGNCNILCVRPGTLNKTMKLLQCIALGIPIVTDKWLQDSAEKTHFLDIKPYIPSIPTLEKELKFSLAAVWSTPQSDLLAGKVVYFTPALKQVYNKWRDVEELCKAIGARRVMSKPGKEVRDGSDIVTLALGEDDPDLAVLIEKGYTCYSKDLLTVGILRGDIDLESGEFKIKPDAGKPKKKGRGRKS